MFVEREFTKKFQGGSFRHLLYKNFFVVASPRRLIGETQKWVSQAGAKQGNVAGELKYFGQA